MKLRMWLRVVLPPVIYIVGFVAVYLLQEAAVWWDVWQFGRPGPDSQSRQFRDVLLMFSAIGYGVYRVVAFHPIYRPGYRNLLMLLPWTVRKPLPLGPVHLVWQDGLVLLVFVALGLPQAHLSPWRLPVFCVFAYLVSLTPTFFVARLWPAAYGMVFGMAFVVHSWINTTVTAAVVVGLYLFAVWGLRKALSQLPEDAAYYEEQAWLSFSTAKIITHRRGKQLGWPFETLHPQPAVLGISHGHGLVISLLVGWWAFTVLAATSQDIRRITSQSSGRLMKDIEDAVAMPERMAQQVRDAVKRSTQRRAARGETRFAAVLLTFAGYGFVFVRPGIYCVGHRSPINIWGRLFTLRWIIPGYDRVFLAPLCAAIVHCASLWALFGLAMSPVIIVPIALSLMCLIALNMGPTLAEWRLTSPCRIAPAQKQRGNKQEYVEI